MANEAVGEEQVFGGENQSRRPARPVWPAILRGAKCRCPRCGEGKLFRAFLKTVDKCEVCGETIEHHRADDLPAYIVITIVGHIVVSAFMAVQYNFDLSGLQHFLIWVPLTIGLSIGLLQPVKGAVVGLQWALYMHGFGGETDEAAEI